MKRKKLILALVSIVSLMATTSFAATWDTCSIREIGAAGADTKMIRFNNCGNSANNNKYLLVINQPDRTMAVALTAFSLGKKLKVYANWGSANTSSPVVMIQTMNLAH